MMISYQLIIYISICRVLVLFFIYFDKTILVNVKQHIHIRWLTLSVLMPHLHNPTQVKLWRFLQSLHSLNVCKAHICLMSHSFYYLFWKCGKYSLKIHYIVGGFVQFPLHLFITKHFMVYGIASTL